MFKLAADPKRWISVTAPLSASSRLSPVWASRKLVITEIDALITQVCAPFESKLAERVAVTDGLLYRRGNFNGSWGQLLCDALMDVQGAQIAFSPGFRWGTTLLPGQAITRELMMDQAAITYPYASVSNMTGEFIMTVLEDVADKAQAGGRVEPRRINTPRLVGAQGNPGLA